MKMLSFRIIIFSLIQNLFLLGTSLFLAAKAETGLTLPSESLEVPGEESVIVQSLPGETFDNIDEQTEDAQDTPNRINYFAIGGNIGLIDDGNTALGNGGFSLPGRFSLTDNLAVHSASVLSDDGIASVALTGGLPIRDPANERISFFPFAGAGISVETNDFTVAPLVTVGVDVPLNNIWIGTARVNASFNDNGTDIGLVFGVGVDILSLF